MLPQDDPTGSANAEAVRVAALHDLGLADEPHWPELLETLELVQQLGACDVASAAWVGADAVGIQSPRFKTLELPRGIAFSTLVVQRAALVRVPDVSKEPLVSENKLVRRFHLRSIVGHPLRAPCGEVIGALVLGRTDKWPDASPDDRLIERLARLVETEVRAHAWSRLFPRDEVRDLPIEALAERALQQPERFRAAVGVRPDVSGAAHARPYKPVEYQPALVQLLGKRGTLAILQRLKDHQVLRFGELLQDIPGMNSRTLSNRLQELQDESLVARQAFAEVPPRVEYELTPEGLELTARLLPLLPR